MQSVNSEKTRLLESSENTNMDRSNRSASQKATAPSGTSQRGSKKKEQSSTKSEDKSDAKSMETEPSKRITERKMPKKATEDEFAKGPFGFVHTLAWVGMVWIMGFGFLSAVTYLHYLRLGETPIYFGEGSFIGNYPRILYEPNPAHYDTSGHGVIEFKKNDLEAKSTHNLVVRYQEIMKAYNVSDYDLADRKDSVSKRTPRVKCGNFSGNEDGSPVNSSCLLDLANDDYGPCALTAENIKQTALGFGEGRPCVLLRLSRLLGWFPEVAEAKGRNCSEPGAKRCCHSRRVTFSCTGAEYEMYPRDGMDTCAYPYWNQQGFQVPFVMLKFNLTDGETAVQCKSNLEGIDSEKNIMKFKFRMN